MFLSLRRLFASLTPLVLAAAVAVPATLPFATESLRAQPLAILPAAALPITSAAIGAASLQLGADFSPALLADDPALLADDDVTFADPDPAPSSGSAALDHETMCLAKAVRHEAGGQAREGQLAVAQLIVNRLRSGRFAGTVCGVVNQQGQFFRTAAYHPDMTTSAWAIAVAVSHEALTGETPSVAPGALFFHAAFQAPTGFFRGRQRVTMLGGNVFYR